MLSEEEYHDILYQLDQSPSEISNNTRKKLRKQIKEHEYSVKFKPFEPSPYIPYFVNRTTTERTLHQLIQAAKTSTEFLLDTESINIYKKENKPVLIQFQIIIPHKFSLVVIVEMCHLPSDHKNSFQLIKELFHIILSNDKKLYIWGVKDELYPFVIFNLFSRKQVNLMETFNLQEQFKIYWIQQHHHQSFSSSSSTTTNNICKCEKCLGKAPSETWSLQDSIAFELNEYLAKQLTIQDFHVGLDPNLYRMNSEELHHRQELTKYAMYDCLSMERILIQMKNKNFNFNINSPKLIKIGTYDTFELSPISSEDDDDQFLFTQYNEPSAPSIANLRNQNELSLNEDKELSMTHPPASTIPSSTKLQRFPSHWESVSSNDDSSNVIGLISRQTSTHRHDQIESKEQSQSAREHEDRDEYEREHRYAREGQSICEHKPEHQRHQLSAEERKRIHNKRCTRRQRTRYYKHEIIVKNIDPRFQPKEIKDILKHKKISFYAVNFSTCSTTHERTLFIGIRDEKNLSSYEREIGHLFTSSHFRQFQHMKQQIKYHHRNNQRRHHQSSHQPRHQTSSNQHRHQTSSNQHLHHKSSNQHHQQK